MAIVSSVLVLICVISAAFAPWLAPHNPFDLATLDLSDARLPPAWLPDGKPSSDGRLAAAVGNYRLRGYRLALHEPELSRDVAAVLALKPEIVILSGK